MGIKTCTHTGAPEPELPTTAREYNMNLLIGEFKKTYWLKSINAWIAIFSSCFPKTRGVKNKILFFWSARASPNIYICPCSREANE